MSYRDSRAYMMAALFVVGNIVLPQLCHLVPQGGLVWLPIYFFTLVAAYKFGLTAGLLTAIVASCQQPDLRYAGLSVAAYHPHQVGIARLGCRFHSFARARRCSLGCCFGRSGLPRDRNAGRVGHDRFVHGCSSRHPFGLAGHPRANHRRLRRYEVCTRKDVNKAARNRHKFLFKRSLVMPKAASLFTIGNLLTVNMLHLTI